MSINDRFYMDIHCHSTQKPFAQSIKMVPAFKNSTDPIHPHSIWHHDPPSDFDKFSNTLWGLTRFRQGDFTSLAKGNVRVVCVPLGPLEQGFVTIRENASWKNLEIFKQDWLVLGPLARFVAKKLRLLSILFDFITGLGRAKLREMKNRSDHRSYFKELDKENSYLAGLNRQSTLTPGIDGQNWSYFLARDYEIMMETLENNPKSIAVIPTIEGVYALGSDLDPKCRKNDRDLDIDYILDNVKNVKGWDFPPFFITFACHFNNRLCHHSMSCPRLLHYFLGFRYRMRSVFTRNGEKIIDRLLDTVPSEHNIGKRILIDIKHMSRRSRAAYIGWLDKYNKRPLTENSNEGYVPFEERVPIMVSHAGVFGSRRWKRISFRKREPFVKKDINIYDDEIEEIFRTGGLIGIQLDERIIGHKGYFKRVKKRIEKIDKEIKSLTDNLTEDPDKEKNLNNEKRKKWIEPVWNQIWHIANVLDRLDESHYSNGQTCWDIACLGTDFDGHIDPINEYWTAKELPRMEADLLLVAKDSLSNWSPHHSGNALNAEEIIDKFMSKNMGEFLRRHL